MNINVHYPVRYMVVSFLISLSWVLVVMLNIFVNQGEKSEPHEFLGFGVIFLVLVLRKKIPTEKISSQLIHKSFFFTQLIPCAL